MKGQEVRAPRKSTGLPSATVRARGRANDFEMALVLFTRAMADGRTEELLEGLAKPSRGRAMAHAKEVAGLGAAVRRGRMAQLFGERPDAVDRVRALLAEAAPALEREIRRCLPVYLRNVRLCAGETMTGPSAYEGIAGSKRAPAAMRAFAARLVREAIR